MIAVLERLGPSVVDVSSPEPAPHVESSSYTEISERALQAAVAVHDAGVMGRALDSSKKEQLDGGVGVYGNVLSVLTTVGIESSLKTDLEKLVIESHEIEERRLKSEIPKGVEYVGLQREAVQALMDGRNIGSGQFTSIITFLLSTGELFKRYSQDISTP